MQPTELTTRERRVSAYGIVNAFGLNQEESETRAEAA